MAVRISVILLVVSLLLLAEAYISGGPSPETGFTSQVATPAARSPH